MPIAEWLLEILACPECRTKVILQANGASLRCPGCHRVYPVRDEIPVMLVSEAVIDPPPDAAR